MSQQDPHPAWLDDPFINLDHILSYNPVIAFLDTPRNRGKSWGVQYRAWKHALRAGRTTILVRRDKKSVKRAFSKIYNAKFCKAFGIDQTRFIRKGDTIFYEVNDHLTIPVLEVCALSERYAQRSSDSGLADLLVIDEANVPPEERHFFRGDPVTNALDIWDSNRRESKMPLLIFGNRESAFNPFHAYFGIPPLPIDFDGIRRYRQKTILVAQSTKKNELASDFSTRADIALAGTRYSEFAAHGKPRSCASYAIIAKMPKNAEWYLTLYVKGRAYSFWRTEAGLWVNQSVDVNRKAFAWRTPFKDAEVINSFNHPRFQYLTKCIKNNAVWYRSPDIGEEIGGIFYK